MFIRIIKIIHVGLGCHLGFNFVHQFCLQKVKKKKAFIIGQNHRNQPEQNEYHLHSIDHNERLNEQQVCVYTSLSKHHKATGVRLVVRGQVAIVKTESSGQLEN